VLLRARAIENLCHIVAPAQSGFHENGRETYGDSLIVDCWGHVLARLPRGTGVISAQIDLVRSREVRHNFPAIDHRRLTDSPA
jgi:nitrilase